MFGMFMAAISFPRILLAFARPSRSSDVRHRSSIAIVGLLFIVAISSSPTDAATKDFGSSPERLSTTTLGCPSTGFTPNIVAKKEDAVLKVLVPDIPSIRRFVDCSDPSKLRGFCIDVFETALSMVAPFNLLSPNASIHYTCFNFSVPGMVRLSYDDMVDLVAKGEYDIVVGDVTIKSDRATLLDFTQKYMDEKLVFYVQFPETFSPYQLFSSPFSWRLWCTIVGVIFAIGILLCYIEREEHPEFKEGNILDRLGSILWFMMGSLILFERDDLKNSSSRVLVMSWLFFAVLLGSSYTASLSALLTTNELSINEIYMLLKNTRSTLLYQRGSVVKDYIAERLGVPKHQLVAMRTYSEFLDNLERGPQKGGALAIAAEIPYAYDLLENLSSSTCNFLRVEAPVLSSEGFGFGCNKRTRYARPLSIAMLTLIESGCLQKIQENYGLSGVLLLCISAHYMKSCKRKKHVSRRVRVIDDDSSIHINASFNMRQRYARSNEMEMVLHT
ncbi:hypothetical protein KP509_03G069800 [Ceratopteris richardii]|uniref:Ionotropic glutamate receptor C-terminal domain-containing protein n=1 Tax=Ceratopteris richardii TaxID=49495 RepID=A0A8T2V0Y8_CERRI|nr:hypothetical protein KP509_03G069800 [Ceratopteris richardii]